MPEDLRKAPWLQSQRQLRDAAKHIHKTDEIGLAATLSSLLPALALGMNIYTYSNPHTFAQPALKTLQ